MTLMHIESHVIHSPEEADLIANAGLPHITTEKQCANCATPVAAVAGKFIPFTLVLDNVKDWVACIRCSSPLLFPRS